MKKAIITMGTIAIVTLGSTFMTSSNTVSAKESLDDVKQERQEVKSKLSKAEKDIANVLYEIKDLNAELADLEQVLKENKDQLKKIENKIKEYEEEISQIEKRIEERNEILKNRIAAYQENGGNPTFMDVLLGSDSFSDLFSKSEAASTIAEADQDLMKEQEKDMKLVEDKKEEQEEDQEVLEEIDTVTKEQIEKKEETKKTLKKKESDLKKKKSTLKSKDNNLSSLEDEIREEIAQKNQVKVNNEKASNSKVKNTNTKATSSNNRGSGKLSWPTQGGYISSTMGMRWNRMHNGIDIARTDRSTSPPIFAADSGTVEFAGTQGGFGNLVVINHGNGMKTKYAHMSSLSVSAGQKVSSGQQLGIMGKTGNSTGIHLHFEVHVNGSIQNPLSYLN